MCLRMSVGYSRGSVGQHTDVCETLQKYTSLHHHQPTPRLVMQDGAAGSVTSHGRCEAALICERNSCRWLVLMFSCKCQKSCAGLWEQVPLRDVGPSRHNHVSFWLSGQKHAHVVIVGLCQCSSCSRLVALLGWRPSTALSSSLSNSLLESSPHCWDCAVMAPMDGPSCCC